MNKLFFSLAVLVLMMAFLQVSAVFGQAVNVTFRVNTATVPDTLVPADSTIELRGSVSPLTWDNLTGCVLKNIPGGDYWTGTFQFQSGDTVHYKINTEGAWEQNTHNADGLPDDGNRSLILGTVDTTIDLQFFNNGASGVPQFFHPWTTPADSFFIVYFRVNMGGIDSTTSPFNFRPNVDTVAVRGAGPAGADLSWGSNFWLTRESQASNGGFSYDATNFWSGACRFPKSQVHPGDTIQYKYLIGYTWGRDEFQGGAPNRIFVVPQGYKDTTLYYGYFNNMKPIVRPNTDTVVVNYVVNMASAIQQRGFSIGDTLQLQSGFFSTATIQDTKMMLRQGLSTKYVLTDTVVSSVGRTLDYQYYLSKNGQSYREVYYNFDYAGNITSEQERRQVIVTSKNLTILDTVTSIGADRRQPVFQNQTFVSQDLTVRFEVDMRPAIYTVKAGKTLVQRQGGQSVTPADVDSILAWGVAINGPATDTTNGWAAWGPSLIVDTTRLMYDDGTHGDLIAGDTIFTRILTYRAGKDIIGQEFKYGIFGSDNEGGYGNNHIQNVDDSQPISTLFTQFGSIDPVFYNAWDYDNDRVASGVSNVKVLPTKYALGQNYPNPFNPSTRIQYDLPKNSVVTLKVYNLLGQEVATLVNGKETAGTHIAVFDASKFTTGVYFYRITADNFTSTKKMILVK